MNIGIVGLGLIGGSLAKSAEKNTDYKVLGYDINASTVEYALLSGVIDERLDDLSIGECDIIFIALYPKATVDFVKKHGKQFKKESIVVDCAGVKRAVCRECFNIAEKNSFHFIGGHPMAGTQFSGLKFAKDTMFHNACFVLTPKANEDISVLSKARDAVISIGFSRVSVMTPEKHDEEIAFTSELAHIVSNAYIKSPSAKEHNGISAGSYKDLTRVAYLNENMWSEIFLENKDNLINEVDNLIAELQKYSDAMKNDDKATLSALLKDGKELKEKYG